MTVPTSESSETADFTAIPASDPLSEGVAVPPVGLGSIGRDALMLAGATIIGKAFSFLMLPLYTHYLRPADYGVIELIELTLDMLSIVTGTRLLGGVFRFYHKTVDEHERKAIISTAMIMVCAGYLAVAIVVFAGAPMFSRLVLGSEQYTAVVRIAALAMATSAPTFVPTPFFRIHGRFRPVVVAQLSRLVIQVSLNILLLSVFHLGAKAMFLSTFVANLVVGTTLTVMVLRRVGLHYSRTAARDLYRFGAPLVLTQVATFVLTFGDRYFLRAATTLDAVGRYTLSYQFAFLLATMAQFPFDMVWEPKKHEVSHRPDRNAIYGRVFVYQNVVLFSFAVALCLFVRNVLQVMTRESYWDASGVVPILVVAIILQAWSGWQDTGIQVTERTRWIAIANWAGAIVVIAAYAVLVPRYAAWGAAIATVIGYAVRYTGIYTAAQRLWPVRWQWTPVLRLVALAVTTVLLGLLVPAGPLALSIAGHFALLAAYLLLAWRLPILSQADRRRGRTALAGAFDSAAQLLRRS
jgi:O-antigen/teichoic acid export membrane protein